MFLARPKGGPAFQVLAAAKKVPAANAARTFLAGAQGLEP